MDTMKLRAFGIAVLCCLSWAAPGWADGNSGWGGVTGSGTVGTGTGPAIAQYNSGSGTALSPTTVSGDFTIAQGGAGTVSKIGGVTISLGGSFTMSGAFGFTGTVTGTTAVTFPTSGTLATTAQINTGLPSVATTSAYCGTGGAGVAEACVSGLVLPNTTTATTQSAGDNSTRLATTAYVSTVEQTVAYAPGPLTAVTATPTGFVKFVRASTVDNITVSASSLTCGTNPTIALLECGTSTTCAAPTTIGSVTVTAAGTATPATVASAAITAGDYVAWEMTAGICTGLDVAGNAQAHAN